MSKNVVYRIDAGMPFLGFKRKSDAMKAYMILKKASEEIKGLLDETVGIKFDRRTYFQTEDKSNNSLEVSLYKLELPCVQDDVVCVRTNNRVTSYIYKEDKNGTKIDN